MSHEVVGTPEPGVLFLSWLAKQRKPTLVNGLTIAETTQLGMDYNNDPETFMEIVRFRNKYIDELDDLQTALTDLQKAKQDHEINQRFYDEMEILSKDKYAGDAKLVTRTALHALVDNKKSLVDQNQDFLRTGENFSRSIVGYFANRLPDRESISINGVTYGSWEGVLTWTDARDNRRVFFGGYDAPTSQVEGIHRENVIVRFAKQNYLANQKANEVKPGGQYVRYAHLDEWQALIDGLNLSAKF